MAETTRSHSSGQGDVARRQRLAELKTAVEAGDYRVSAELVAAKMLRRMESGNRRERVPPADEQARRAAKAGGEKLC